MKHLTQTLILAILLFGNIYAQTLINQEWVVQYGLPDTITWSASTTDGSGNLYTAGNTINPNGHADVLLTKYDPEGNLLWQQTYDHTGENDYGVAILLHSNGELTVAAAVYDPANDFDIGILHYDSGGNLQWTTSHDYEGDYDLPTALDEDAGGNIYITAASMGTTTNLDYLTMKLNPEGNIIWMESYDFASGRDFPVSLIVDGDIIVTGASDDGTGQWDFYTVMYNNGGQVMEDYRLDKPGIGFDEPAAIARDVSGNFYLTGRASDNGTDYYVQTVKLDPQLNLLWEVSYNHSGQDGATGLGLDSQGNVYVCGYLSDPNESELLLVKYNPNGDLLWDRVETAESGGAAAATGMHIDWEDQIYITGYKAVNSQQRLYVAAFNKDGEKLWERLVEDGEYLGGDIITNGTDAYVSGQSYSNGNYQYIAVKFTIWSRTPDIYEGGPGDPAYIENELLVRFNPELIDPAFVDNPELTFGQLGELIPSHVITAMNQATASGFDFSSVMVEKVHKRMTRADSVSISRDGHEVRIPSFWSRLVLVLPEILASRSAHDEKMMAINLSTLTDYIWYAEPQYLGQLQDIPNDAIWPDQLSINNDPQFTNATVHADPAWDINNGLQSVRVGVYDTGIDWRHEDFSIDGSNTFSGSKIAGGRDFANNVDLEFSVAPDGNGHGTSCAAIIGALRNNSIGIAGIAGGDMAANTPNPGAQLFGMKITDDDGRFLSASTISAAIEEGAAFNATTGFGFGLHIMNHSWNTSVNSKAIEEAVRFSFENQATFVNSRGNWTDENNPDLINLLGGVLNAQFWVVNLTQNDNDLTWPACYEDKFVISVGGIGDDGEWKQEGNGSWDGTDPQAPRADILDDFRRAMRGNDVDIAAPATRALVWTAEETDGITFDQYGRFGGTSAAAPHVSGAAALMMSEQNNQGQFTPLSLAPDDIEFLVQKYADDRGTVGYDDETGWGILDIQGVMEQLDFPAFQVFHSGNPSSRNQTTTLANFQVLLGEAAFGLPAGTYYGDRVQITDNYSVVFPTSFSVLNHWELESAVRGFYAASVPTPNDPLDTDNWQSLNLSIQGNVVSATATTNAWFIREDDQGVQINQWIPAPPADLRTAFSLHLRDNSVPTSIDKVGSSGLVSLFPNPAKDYLSITYDGIAHGPVSVSVWDLNGREVRHKTYKLTASDENTFKLDIQQLSDGMYFCKLVVGQESYRQPFIKN